jgi:uncharacterized membrane protein
MDNAFKIVLSIHIAFGTVALIIAPLAMMTVKGGRWHRRWGEIYFWAMAGVAVSATVTAFSVVNFQFFPYFWRWLGPTIIGVPGIILWRLYYARKFAKQRAA